MNVQDLVNAINGQYLTITGGDEGQCTAVAHKWEQMLGLPIVYGNAADTYAAAGQIAYDLIPNTPDGVPLPGSIMVWHQDSGIGTGGAGHTAVFISGDVNSFDSLDQNWPLGSPVHIQHHSSYEGVTGWFYPKVLEQQSPQPSNQGEAPMTADEEKLAYEIVLGREPEGPPTGRTGIEFIKEAQPEVAQQRANTANQLSTLQTQVTTLSAQVTDLTNQAHSQQATIDQLNAEITSLKQTPPPVVQPEPPLVLPLPTVPVTTPPPHVPSPISVNPPKGNWLSRLLQWLTH